MKNLEKEKKLLQAKKNLITAGIAAASIGTATIPIGVALLCGVNPFDRDMELVEYVNTTTEYNLLTGEGTHDKKIKTYRNSAVNLFPKYFEEKIDLHAAGKAYEEDGKLYWVYDQYSIPFTEENCELVNNFNSIEEIKSLELKKVNSTTEVADIDLDEFKASLGDNYDSSMELLDRNNYLIFDSYYLNDEITTVDKTTYQTAMEAALLGAFILAGYGNSLLIISAGDKIIKKQEEEYKLELKK